MSFGMVAASYVAAVSTNVWRQAVNDAAAGTGQARILCVGDSFVQGEGASARSNRWIDGLVGSVRSRYGIAGTGVGLTPYYYNTYLSVSAGWRRPGQPTAMTPPSWFVTQSNHGVQLSAGEYVEWVVSGDAADIIYAQGSGQTIVVTVDGVAAGSVNTNNASYEPGHSYRVSLGALGSHTIRCTASGGVVVIDGVVSYGGDSMAGVTYWDCSIVGGTANDFVSSTDYQMSWVRFLPHLIIDDLVGSNEYLNNTGATPAQVASRLTDRIAVYKSLASQPVITVMIPWNAPGIPTGANGSGYTINQYWTAAINTAISAGVSVLDLRSIYPTAGSEPWHDADGLHPNNVGHTKIRDAFDSFLANS